MRKVCAWCKKDLGIKDSSGISNNVITHGICQDCVVRVSSGFGKSLDAFLDRLKVPIILFDSERRAFTANSMARILFDKELPEIQGEKTGDIIECVHAKNPGGCGSHIHCKSCILRSTILETFRTGKSFVKIPAYPDIQQFMKTKTLQYSISTEKVGDFVFLRIDDIAEKQEAQAG